MPAGPTGRSRLVGPAGEDSAKPDGPITSLEELIHALGFELKQFLVNSKH